MTQALLPDLSQRPLEFTVDRTIAAPADVLLRAWTKQLDHWFARPGSVLMNGEVNTAFFFETDRNGERHAHYGRILRIERNTMVQFTWLSAATKGAETVVTIRFLPNQRGTHVLLTHAGFPDPESRDAHEAAWPQVLAELDRRIASAA
jgi:uncharacterized protein YndB with AHSA1/START domain